MENNFLTPMIQCVDSTLQYHGVYPPQQQFPQPVQYPPQSVAPIELFYYLREYYQQQTIQAQVAFNNAIASIISPSKTQTSIKVVKADKNDCKLYYEFKKTVGGTCKMFKHDICFGIPVECLKCIYDKKYNILPHLVIKWNTNRGTVYTNIPLNKLSEKYFIRELINSGAIILGCKKSEQELSSLIAGYMYQNIDFTDVYIPYNAGWNLYSENMEFLFNRDTNSMLQITDAGYFNNILNYNPNLKEAACLQQVVDKFAIFKKASYGYLLLVILVYSMIRSILGMYDILLKRIIAFTGDSSIKADIAHQYLEIYNTDHIVNNMLTNEKRLKDIVYNHKDDVIVLSESFNKNKDEILVKDMLVDMVVNSAAYTYDGKDKYSIESTIAVINNRILYQYQSQHFLVFPITNECVNNNNIRKYNAEIIPTFVYYFTQYIEHADIELEEIILRAEKEAQNRFDSYESKSIFIPLFCASEILENYSKAVCGRCINELCGISTIKDVFIEAFVRFNEDYDNLEDAADEFVRVFNNYISTKPCVVFDDCKGEVLLETDESDCPIIYKKKKSIYISMDDLKKYIFAGNNSYHLCVYLDALKKQGYLNANYGPYTSRPTLHYPDKGGQRKAMIEIDSSIFESINNL